MAELTADELLMLQFEDRRWRRGGPTAGAIRRQLGLSPQEYRQRLDGIIDRPEAMAVAPQAVRRLRAQRAALGERLVPHDRAV